MQNKIIELKVKVNINRNNLRRFLHQNIVSNIRNVQYYCFDSEIYLSRYIFLHIFVYEGNKIKNFIFYIMIVENWNSDN